MKDNILPSGHRVKQAVKWIVEQTGIQNQPIQKLIQEAALKFNLSPKEEEELVHFYREKKEPCESA